MSREQQRIAGYVRRVRARMGFARGLSGALRAVFYASLVLLVAVAVHRLVGVSVPLVWTASVLGAGILLIGLATAFLPRIDLMTAAAAADERAGWKERISSALALESVEKPMEAALVEDADARLNRRRPSELFPLSAPREVRYVPLVAVLVAAVTFLVPELDLLGYRAEAREARVEREEIEVALQKLERHKKQLKKLDKKPGEKEQEILDKIDALMKDLSKKSPPDKKQALAQVSSLADELQKLKNERGKAQALARKIQKAMSKEGPDAGELGRMLKAGRFKDAIEALAAMRKAARKGEMTPEERKKLEEQLQAMKDRLGDSPDMSEMEKRLADAMQGLNQNSMDGLQGLEDMLGDLDADLSDPGALADALQDLKNLANAMKKDQGECPSCGKKGGT